MFCLVREFIPPIIECTIVRPPPRSKSTVWEHESKIREDFSFKSSEYVVRGVERCMSFEAIEIEILQGGLTRGTQA